MEKQTPVPGIWHKTGDETLLELRISSTGVPVFVHSAGSFVPARLDGYILVEPGATLADFGHSAVPSGKPLVDEFEVLCRFTEAVLRGLTSNAEVISDANDWPRLAIASVRAARVALRELADSTTSQFGVGRESNAK